jgi:hypothetical protein
LVPEYGPQLRMVVALQKVDIHLPALGKGSTSIQFVLRDHKPRTSVMWFSRCAASIGVGLSFMSSGTFRIYALI